MTSRLRLACRLALLSCIALLAAGIGGVVAVRHHHHHAVAGAPISSNAVPTTSPGSSSAPGPSPTTAPAGPSGLLPSETDLQSALLVPNDLGGYYSIFPADSAPQLAASGCLANLGKPAEAVRRAVQYLRGPFGGDLPIINEQLSVFASASAAATAFQQLSAILRSCTSTTLSLPTGPVPTQLQTWGLPQLGDEAAAEFGPWTGSGHVGRTNAAVVRMGVTVLVFVYADRMPPSLPILGSALSTLQAAAGKASP